MTDFPQSMIDEYNRKGIAGRLASGLPSPEDLRRLQQEQIDRVAALLRRLPIADVHALGNAIEHHYAGSTNLRAALMKERGEKVRVAEWYMDTEHRCQHKRYAEGNSQRAKHGEIGDASWLEAWIA